MGANTLVVIRFLLFFHFRYVLSIVPYKLLHTVHATLFNIYMSLLELATTKLTHTSYDLSYRRYMMFLHYMFNVHMRFEKK